MNERFASVRSRALRRSSLIACVGAIGLLLTVGATARRVGEAAGAAKDELTPVVFVPGMTGTRLEDPRDGRVVWGTGRQLLRPRDGGYEVALPLDAGPTATPGDHPQARYEPVEPLWELKVTAWTKPIYGPLRARFEAAGYSLGRLEEPAAGGTLFFFNYDWRRGNLESVGRLAHQLTELAAARGGRLELDLICQSNAARICRYLVKYGAASLEQAESGRLPDHPFSVRRVVLVGASNDGAVRAVQLLTQGRSYIPLVGRRFHPELFFTLRPLFEDLPAGADAVFFDSGGKRVQVDLYAAGTWRSYGWSIFDRETRQRLARAEREDLFADEAAQMAYLRRRLDTARRLHRLLTEDAPRFPTSVRYYRLENRATPTMNAAFLMPGDGGWRTLFAEDRAVSRDPALRALATAPGDGHATLDSQRRLSPQEEAAMVDSFLGEGGHFEMVIAPESLDALLGFLSD